METAQPLTNGAKPKPFLSSFAACLSTPCKGMRVAYDGSASDVFGSFAALESGAKDGSIATIGYSELAMRACRTMGVDEMLVLTRFQHNPPVVHYNIGGFRVTVRSIPNVYEMKARKPWFRRIARVRAALRYHAASYLHAMRIHRELVRFGAHVFIAGDTPERAHALKYAVPDGCRLVRAHHCAIFPPHARSSLSKRVLQKLDSFSMDGRISAVLSASDVVTAQARKMFPNAAISEFLPLFDAELHGRAASPLPPMESRGELRVVFIGRAEENKGIFDLIEIAKYLQKMSIHRITFDVCGDGSALHEFKQRVALENVGRYFRIHGWCDRAKMQEILAQAHLGIVPTRSSFNEGMNQTCFEIIGNGRPVITSDAIPALEYARGATFEAERDNPESYARLLKVLYDSPEVIPALVKNCANTFEKFTRADVGYQRALEHVLLAFGTAGTLSDRTITHQGLIEHDFRGKRPGYARTANIS